jgi:hypothetical protein
LRECRIAALVAGWGGKSTLYSPKMAIFVKGIPPTLGGINCSYGSSSPL